MTRDDIIRMAREAGIDAVTSWKEPTPAAELIERFAALVAAAEREACAKECWEFYSIEGIAQKCNAAIRARGSK